MGIELCVSSEVKEDREEGREQMGFMVNLALTTQLGHEIIKGPSVSQAGNNVHKSKEKRQSCTVEELKNTAGDVVLHNNLSLYT